LVDGSQVEAGLIDQTLFRPPELIGGASAATAYAPALGISVSDLLSFVFAVGRRPAR
jgi:hypothetical protein